MWPLRKLLSEIIHNGSLIVIDPDGRQHAFGDGTEPRVTVRLSNKSLYWRLAINPELALGEAYMNGSLRVEGDIYDLLALALRNIEQDYIERGSPRYWPLRLVSWLRRMKRRIDQFNPQRGACRHVAHHYDLPDRLYDLFLESDRQYSCAYYLAPTDTLEKAQEQKKRHIAAKLLLKPGQKVLDIGCGWGGLGLYLAKTADIDVTGITLSGKQQKAATDRARALGLADRVRFDRCDYRTVTGQYDRIVSVGMFEHVGINHYDRFFSVVCDHLREDGIALLHTIGRGYGPEATNPWIRKYIFPGGYIPALSEILPAIERSGLLVTDLEVLRLHYAETLKAWRQRFRRHWSEAQSLLGDRFCRMWDFYLAGSEATFRYNRFVVFQLQLAKHLQAVPMARDYVTDFERRPPPPHALVPTESDAA
jgi:cyclopropane-fatty-acyl-phospholipid synthase